MREEFNQTINSVKRIKNNQTKENGMSNHPAPRNEKTQTIRKVCESVAFSQAIQHPSSGTRNFEPRNVTDLFCLAIQKNGLGNSSGYE